jgi:ankyrin repeat protein
MNSILPGLGPMNNDYKKFIKNIKKSIEDNDIDTLQSLIEECKSDEDKLKFEELAVARACDKNYIETIKSLLEKYKSFREKDTFIKFILFKAFMKDEVNIIKFLYNQDINITSEIEFNYLLDCSITNENYELVELLLKGNLNFQIHNKNLNKLYSKMYSNFKDKAFDLIKLLLERGIDINNSESKNEFSFLLFACNIDRLDIIDYLIKKGANIEITGYEMYTPLKYACKEGKLQLVKFLVENGADVNGKSDYIGRPITIAYDNGNLDIVKYLLDKGAYIL